LVRKRNEDSFFAAPDLPLAVVADGMGGAPAGELASRLAVEAVVSLARGERWPAEATEDQDGLGAFARRAVARAEAAVTDEARRNPHNRGLGSTLTFLALDPNTRNFAVGHVGDSRVYRYRGGALELLSLDHTLAQESVDEGRLPADAVRHHPFAHILTRVIGMEGALEPMVVSGTAQSGDVFFLCTDGIVRVIEDAEIAEALGAAENLEQAAAGLVDEANERGGPDNSTVVLLRVP